MKDGSNWIYHQFRTDFSFPSIISSRLLFNKAWFLEYIEQIFNFWDSLRKMPWTEFITHSIVQTDFSFSSSFQLYSLNYYFNNKACFLVYIEQIFNFWDSLRKMPWTEFITHSIVQTDFSFSSSFQLYSLNYYFNNKACFLVYIEQIFKFWDFSRKMLRIEFITFDRSNRFFFSFLFLTISFRLVFNKTCFCIRRKIFNF